MYCKKCGKQITDDSLFCKFCGASVQNDHDGEPMALEPLAEKRCAICGSLIYGESETCSLCERFRQPDNNQILNTIDESENEEYVADQILHESDRKIKVTEIILATIIVLGIGVAGVICNFIKTPTALVQSTSSLSSSANTESIDSRTVRRAEVSAVIAKVAKGQIEDYLKNPDTLEMDYQASTMEYYDAYGLSKGNVEYTNSQGQPVNASYEVGAYTNGKYSYPVYVKLGDKVLLDNRSSVNNQGIALNDFYIGNKYITKGTAVLDNLLFYDDFFKDINETDTQPSSNIPSDGKITLDAYNQIQAGMSYDEVSKIVGSSGTVMSETDLAGYHTFMIMWYGHGSVGANANVTIQNDKVISKAQFGLN